MTDTDILRQVFGEIGYTDDHYLIYQYYLSNYESAVLQCSKDLSINRTKVYRILDQLNQDGLIIKEDDTYRSLKPSKITHKLKHKQNKLSYLQRKLDIWAEQWGGAYYDTKQITTTRLSADIISQIYQTLHTSSESEIKVFNIGKSFYDFVKTEQEDFAKERSEKGIYVRLLASENNEYLRTSEEENQALKRSIKFLDKTYNNLPMVFLSDDKLVMCDFNNSLSLSTSNKQFVALFENMFESIWKTAK